MSLALLDISHAFASMSLIAATTKKSSSSASTLILFVLLFGAMYFLWLRPQRKKMQQRQIEQVRSIDVGDEVVTQSGIIGTVVELDEDRAQIQISNGVVIIVVRAAIGRRIEPVAPASEVPEAGGEEAEDDTAYEHDDVEDESFDAGSGEQPPERGRFWQRRNRGEDA